MHIIAYSSKKITNEVIMTEIGKMSEKSKFRSFTTKGYFQTEKNINRAEI